MRILLTTLATLAIAGPVFADHAGIIPGQAQRDDSLARDYNEDGETNALDYAPGQSAQAGDSADLNNDGRTNGKDYAPGQLPRR